MPRAVAIEPVRSCSAPFVADLRPRPRRVARLPARAPGRRSGACRSGGSSAGRSPGSPSCRRPGPSGSGWRRPSGSPWRAGGSADRHAAEPAAGRRLLRGLCAAFGLLYRLPGPLGDRRRGPGVPPAPGGPGDGPDPGRPGRRLAPDGRDRRRRGGGRLRRPEPVVRLCLSAPGALSRLCAVLAWPRADRAGRRRPVRRPDGPAAPPGAWPRRARRDGRRPASAAGRAVAASAAATVHGFWLARRRWARPRVGLRLLLDGRDVALPRCSARTWTAPPGTTSTAPEPGDRSASRGARRPPNRTRTPGCSNVPTAPVDREPPLEHGGDDRAVRVEQQVVGVGLVAVGQGDDGEVGRLAGLEAAGGGLGAEGPGAEEGGHRQQERPPESDGSRAVEEADLVEDAQASGVEARLSVPRQTTTPALEHRAVRVRGVAEPGVGPRAVGDRHALAVGGGLGAELPELGRVEVGAVGDQPVGLAELAACGRSRPAGGRSAPSRRPRRRGLRGTSRSGPSRCSRSSSSSGISARWVESGSRLDAARW